MNQSSSSHNGSLVSSREPYHVAVTKNMIVLALGLTINSINGMLVHTFSKHQIFYTTPRYILFIHLVINDMIQLTTSVILHISSYLFVINTSVCLIFISVSFHHFELSCQLSGHGSGVLHRHLLFITTCRTVHHKDDILIDRMDLEHEFDWNFA
ncbi:unnamed protein product [Knipowitschia caucasica]